MRSDITNWIFKNVAFVLFLSLLGLVYIFNAHKAENKLRTIQQLKKEVSDAKNQYHQVKSEMMYQSTESQLAKKLEQKELKSNDDLPVVLGQG